MPGMAAKVVITKRQQQVLQTWVTSRGSAQGLAHRAEIILLAFDGFTNQEIADKLHCERHGVGIWRKRWQKAFHRLTLVECMEKPPALRAAISEVLGDLPRAGCGGKFTAEPIAQIIAVACEPPEHSQRPVTHWTPRELTEEVRERFCQAHRANDCDRSEGGLGFRGRQFDDALFGDVGAVDRAFVWD